MDSAERVTEDMISDAKDRAEKLREKYDRPSENPRYDGATPGDIARSLLRPVDKPVQKSKPKD